MHSKDQQVKSRVYNIDTHINKSSMKLGSIIQLSGYSKRKENQNGMKNDVEKMQMKRESWTGMKVVIVCITYVQLYILICMNLKYIYTYT